MSLATHKSWIFLDFAHRLKSPPAQRLVAARKLVSYRSPDGTVFVADDACPHRGAALHTGHVRGSCVVCPYHAMAVCPTQHDDRFIDTVESRGGVWVDSGMGAPTAHKTWTDPPECPEFSDPAYRTIEYSKRVPVNPVLMTENTLDWKHLDIVHRFSLVEGDPTVTIHETGSHGKATYAYKGTGAYDVVIENEYWVPFTTSLRFRFTEKATGKTLPPLLLWFSLSPIDLSTCELNLRISRAALKWFPVLTDALFMVVDELPLFEDVALVQLIDPALWSQNVLGPNDAFVAAYREAMARHCHHILRDFVL